MPGVHFYQQSSYTTMATTDQTPPDRISSDEYTEYCQCPPSTDAQDDGRTGPLICAKCLHPTAPENHLTAMTSQSFPDQKDVYHAFRYAFDSKTQRLAKQKKTKRLRMSIRKVQDQEAVARLINQHGMETVYNSVSDLLALGVFASPVTAVAHFPDLFSGLPVDDQDREAPDAESETIALQDTVHIHPTENLSRGDLENEGTGV